MPFVDAVAALLGGINEVLRDFTDEEARLLFNLLTRLIANLDRAEWRAVDGVIIMH